jgi:Na+-translocating ferredoxin:NAD+ oxidoreductase RnfC subunit
MDNYQSSNVIMQLEKIAELLKAQNEMIAQLLQPQEDAKTQRRKALQDAIRRAEENKIKTSQLPGVNANDVKPSNPQMINENFSTK